MKEYPKNTAYLIYKDGRIYSKRFKKFLTPKLNWDGYHRIQIWKDGKCRMVSWHRIIAETFIPNPENKPFINHIDGNKQNNSVYNLEWCTQKENIEHAIKNKLYHVTQLNQGKVPVDMLDTNGSFIKRFNSQLEAGEFIKRHPSSIGRCCKFPEKYKSCGGYKWRYSKTSND